MMALNNSILEGKVVGFPVFLSEDENKGIKACEIEIETKKLNGDTFKAKAIGYNRVAEIMKDRLKDGREIRIVGKLDANAEFGLFLIIEHLEMKPDFKK